MVLLTGNQIGALLADYRISTLKEGEIISAEGGENIALIKTFVTSPLQEAIASSHGIKTINTLTGFKWIGARLATYETKMKENLYEEEGLVIDQENPDHVEVDPSKAGAGMLSSSTNPSPGVD